MNLRNRSDVNPPPPAGGLLPIRVASRELPAGLEAGVD